MRTPVAQRWLLGEEIFLDSSGPVRAADWEVVRLAQDREAKAFVQANHYQGTYTAARERFGLYHVRSLQLCGVAVFDVPAQPKCLDVLPGPAAQKLHFGRLVLLPEVPGNGESLFIGDCYRQLRRLGYGGVVSFADPVPRARVDGTVIHPGHLGGVYMATNGRLVGRSKPDTLWLMPDGSALQRRAQSKVRKLEQGWRYVARALMAAGAEPLEVGEQPSDEDRAHASAWLEFWKGKLCRPARHSGNYKYVWGFDASSRRHVERLPSMPYPEPPGGRVPPKWGRRTTSGTAKDKNVSCCRQ